MMFPLRLSLAISFLTFANASSAQVMTLPEKTTGLTPLQGAIVEIQQVRVPLGEAVTGSETRITFNFTLQGCLDSLMPLVSDYEVLENQVNLYITALNAHHQESTLALCREMPQVSETISIPGVFQQEQILVKFIGNSNTVTPQTSSNEGFGCQRTDYQKLENLLAEQNWQGADAETRCILQSWVHPNQDLYSIPQGETIPVEVIMILDQMWQQASGGHFGFKVQQRLWQQALKEHPHNLNAAVEAFGDQVSWTRSAAKPDQTFIAPEWLTEPELTFTLNAPAGHLPWAGISWETISNMISQAGPGCGICTIDAMYLQGERFNRYLPVLYHRVDTAFDIPNQPNVK